MTRSRILIALSAVTVVMQAAILWKQYRKPGSARTQIVQDAPKGTVIDISGLPIEGDSTTSLVIVEFSDYECPFCARHAFGAGRDLREKFVATGKVRHAFVNNPLDIHRNARSLALAAICAGHQNRHWEMSEKLFATSRNAPDALASLAASVLSDGKAFVDCLDASGTRERLDRDIAMASELRLASTPSFAVGRVDRPGRLAVRKIIVGAQPIEVFAGTLNELLKARAPDGSDL